jgi:hypothetical protein
MKDDAKKRSKKLNLLFDLDVDYLISIAPINCPIFNIKINYLSERKSRDSPSLDKIDPKKGYTKDNVQIISDLANRMKYTATKEELILFAEWVFRTYK